MTDDEVRLLRTGGVGVSAIERLADEALRRGGVIVEAQALHRQAVADRAKYEAALGFYAAPECWTNDSEDRPWTDAEADKGAKARTALGKS